MEQEGSRRRPQIADRVPGTTRRTPPSSATTTHAPGDLRTMQRPSLDDPLPDVIHDLAPLPSPLDLDQPSQLPAVSPGGTSWERFRAVMGRYTVAEIRERGSGSACIPPSFSLLGPLPSRRIRRARVDSPERQQRSGLSAWSWSDALERQRQRRRSEQQLRSVQEDPEYQRLGLVLEREPPANNPSSRWYLQAQEEHMIPQSLQTDAQLAQNQEAAHSSSYSRHLESYLPRELLREIDEGPLPQRWAVDPLTLEPAQSVNSDDARSRAADDGQSESGKSSEDGNADDEAERTGVQQPTPPITPPTTREAHWRATASPEQRMAAFRAQVRQQMQEAAQRRSQPSPPVHPLERSPVFRATPSGGGLELLADVSIRPAGTLEANDDMPSYFLDGEGAVR